MKRAAAIILFVLLADQALKVWVKLTFTIGQHIPEHLDSWYYLHFIENEGMAFGMKLGGEYGKLALTLLRIAAVIGIGFALRRMVAQQAPRLQVVSVSLVLAGALGNIIDSTFYGLVFSASTPDDVAELLPPEGGYASLFHGAVVDMFHFPIWRGQLPQWIPRYGGSSFEFFQPVFNIADASITIGIVLFIAAQRMLKRSPAMDDSSAAPPAQEQASDAPPTTP
ncbi:MAG: lipoprotein signal peptidase [Flavobacteriales bacterium]|nr:lipoprotein signal peptidase [Flavobacteriales bacterium]